jgi:carbamoyltransferase
MQPILSICDNHDAGACVIENERIKFAINEERLNRIKIYTGMPDKSISECLSRFDTNKRTILASKNTPHFIFRLFPQLHNSIKSMTKTSYFNYLFNLHIIYSTICDKSVILKEAESYLSKKLIENRLNQIENKRRINIIDHHLSHASSAYYTSDLNKALVITMDSIGDGVSLTVNIGKCREIRTIFKQSGINNICVYYSQITELLGFRPLLDEGKITGLAAYGNAKHLEKDMQKLLSFKGNKFNRYNPFIRRNKNKGLFNKFGKYKKEDVAAALQSNLEKQVCRFISYWMENIGVFDVVLAGGIFANVKLNQRIHSLDKIKSIYIFPHMGDGGLAVGAGLAYVKPLPFRLDNVYLGPEFSEKDIHKELLKKKNHVFYEKIDEIEYQVAELLAKGKTIARFNGRMEYGPRTLGNRSILYQTTDKSVNDWLNKKLERTEFMPFAPTTLHKYADKCYKGLNGAEYTSKFMNISFDCTDYMKKMSPGVVHIDGTARPQIIEKKDNISYHKIIDEYRKITSIPSILNTSFNMHEEPIVCIPFEAISAFRKSRLDYLAIGNFLVTNKN